jgi:uncharacterized protein (DUF1499 family)
MANQSYIVNGYLRTCEDRLNCVSTTPPSTKKRFIKPFTYAREMYGDSLKEMVKKLVQKNFKANTQKYGESYMHFEIKSGLFGSIIDLEILMIPVRREIHFRSCSRKKIWNFGANEMMIHKLKKLLEKELSK